MQEQWKAIKDYEGLYEVSNLGHIKSVERISFNKNGIPKKIKEKILQPKKSKSGYLEVQLYKAGKTKMCYVHRLVAASFIPNPKNKPQVNHIDEDKLNNCYDNLEWTTNLENINHGTGKYRRAQNYKTKVYQYTLDGAFIRECDSAADCKPLGFCPSSVTRCCKGIYKQHKGYVWSYAPPKGDIS